jgi:AAA domain, putative AbiEii toxin, Type IV TA system/AAA ATPase domain
MIRSLSLKNFKAFENFRISFDGDGYLVGPNNAGKSTVIAALRSVANMVRMASRAQPAQSLEIDGFQQTGYWFTSAQINLVDENLQHEFHQVETRLKAKFASGAVLEAVWPLGEEGGFFFILDQNDVNLIRLSLIREVLPAMGVVPVLAPADHSEELLSEKHIRVNLDGRLASRHFRNQLYLLKNESAKVLGTRLDEFKAFADPWISELELADLDLRRGDGKTSFDLNYREPGSRIPKEIFWTGDGMQIWLQLLLHIFRLQDQDVVVLDEPDVFLHSDLQRRLVNLLESVEAQTITATHSAEVISEAPDEAVIWVSRERVRAVRAPRRDVLIELSATLGTQFNLPLAKALKTKVVVFVEGQDAKILRNIAKTLSCKRLVQEDGVTIIPLGGFNRWVHVEPFQWLMNEFLEDAVTVHVVLDRDYRSPETAQKIRRQLRDVGVKPHIWKRNEIENYLLVPRVLARLSGADEQWVQDALARCAEELETEVYSEISSDVIRENKGRGKSHKTLSKEAKERADGVWGDPGRRLSVCGGRSY